MLCVSVVLRSLRFQISEVQFYSKKVREQFQDE